MPLKIKLQDIGRDKKSWIITAPDHLGTYAIESRILKSLLGSGALLSRSITLDWITESRGEVLAGFRTVGRFELAPELQ